MNLLPPRLSDEDIDFIIDSQFVFTRSVYDYLDPWSNECFEVEHWECTNIYGECGDYPDEMITVKNDIWVREDEKVNADPGYIFWKGYGETMNWTAAVEDMDYEGNIFCVPELDKARAVC